MTFYVGTRFTKEFELKDGDESFSFKQHPEADVYWIFQFGDGDLDKIQGEITDDNTAQFEIPDNFFTEDRIGVLRHQLYVTGESPILISEFVNDKLIKGGPSLGELGID